MAGQELSQRPSTEELQRRKLRFEIRKLISETGQLGIFARLGWPILSSILTAIIGMLTVVLSYSVYKIQQNQTALRHREVFLQALRTATDGSAGIDARIGGLWSLDQFWDESPVTIANTLAAVLATGPDFPKSEERSMNHIVRLNAAEVIGDGISGTSSATVLPREQMAFRSLLLFGNVHRAERGAVTRIHWYLVQQRTAALQRHDDVGELDLKIDATRAAIRRCYKYLEDAHFGLFDLTDAHLHDADLARAFFGDAILYKADLHRANLAFADVLNTDLRCANLEGASLSGLQRWRTIKSIREANLRNVVDAPPGFRDWALTHGAVDMDPAEWQARIQQTCTTLPLQ